MTGRGGGMSGTLRFSHYSMNPGSWFFKILLTLSKWALPNGPSSYVLVCSLVFRLVSSSISCNSSPADFARICEVERTRIRWASFSSCAFQLRVCVRAPVHACARMSSCVRACVRVHAHILVLQSATSTCSNIEVGTTQSTCFYPYTHSTELHLTWYMQARSK